MRPIQICVKITSNLCKQQLYIHQILYIHYMIYYNILLCFTDAGTYINIFFRKRGGGQPKNTNIYKFTKEVFNPVQWQFR